MDAVSLIRTLSDYTIIKREDASRYLTEEELFLLDKLARKIDLGRLDAGAGLVMTEIVKQIMEF